MLVHKNFTLKGEKMQLFESFPFTVITDVDGTELVYIRKHFSDDDLCDVVYVAGCIYKFANWQVEDLERWVGAYCNTTLGLEIASVQRTEHIVLPTIGLSDFVCKINGLELLVL